MSGTEIICQKRGGRLEPVDQVNAEEMNSIPNGVDLIVTVKVPRNPKQLRLIWSLATVVGLHISDETNATRAKEAGMNALCEASRHCDVVVSPLSGHAFFVRKSIPEDAAELSRLINRMVWITCTQIIPNMPEGDLRKKLEEMTAPRDERDRR